MMPVWLNPFSALCNVTCHAYLVLPICLSLLLCIPFACLPTCSCMLSILQPNGTMDTGSKPIFVLLGLPLLFDNMLVCPVLCLEYFVCPRLALFASMFFACYPYFLCFFLCLATSLFLLSLQVHT